MSRGAAAACASTSVVHAAAIAGGRRYVIAAGLGRVELPICVQASVFSSICCRQLQLHASLLFRHCSIILLAYPSLALDQLLLLRLKSIAGAELVLSLAPRVLLPVACRPGLLGCVEGLQSIQAGQHQRCARLAAAVKEQEQGRPNLPNLTCMHSTWSASKSCRSKKGQTSSSTPLEGQKGWQRSSARASRPSISMAILLLRVPIEP
mgnify:CR=1 FL=1